MTEPTFGTFRIDGKVWTITEWDVTDSPNGPVFAPFAPEPHRNPDQLKDATELRLWLRDGTGRMKVAVARIEGDVMLCLDSRDSRFRNR